MLIDEFNKKIEKIEDEYIFQNLSYIKKNREKEINFLFDNNIKNNDFNNNIEILHEISMKKGGFINMENRRKIYKYILNNLKNENNDLNNNSDILVENKNYDNTVDADCERSILHKIVNNNFSIKNYDKNKITISKLDIK